jgi:putative nucleotidyltransferase-like protein
MTAVWRSLDRLLDHADVDGIRAHKLGPLAARRLRELDRAVPALLAHDARAAATAMLVVPSLLEQVRASCEGPLVLFKGPEVARLYPGSARLFLDVDMLTPAAESVHGELRAAGFVEVDDPELFVDHHHLRPLKLPTLPLKVEVHMQPAWPSNLEPPPIREIIDRAVPSELGIAGISTPDRVHHALILAAHAWVHEPLHTLRDLVDVTAVAAGADPMELERTAQAWGVGRIWRTTRGAASMLLDGGPLTGAVRLWARHLEQVRERTVLDNHLERWLHVFWELPPRAAVAALGHALRQELLPEAEESWPDKLTRVAFALRHPRAPLSVHTSRWRLAAAERRARSHSRQ